MYLKLKKIIAEAVLLISIFNIIFIGIPISTVMAATVEIKTEKVQTVTYSQLMRDIRKIKVADSKYALSAIPSALKNLEILITEEKTRFEKFKISDEKQKKYFGLLEKQISDLKEIEGIYMATTTADSKTVSRVLEITKNAQLSKFTETENLKNLKKPSEFNFSEEKVVIKGLKKLNLTEKLPEKSPLSSIFSIKTAMALAPQFLPVIEDIQPDAEVLISPAIENLAFELNNNPVEITNYIKNNIDYEPYYGAKKGSVGCLEEKLCNDVDAASLTIALMRAAGIPARYKKGLAVMPVEQLKSMLGVDETKTVYYALYNGNVPVHTLNGTQIGVNIDAADFSNETHFGVEWVYPEIFYEYDERGANIDNYLDTSAVTTTLELQALFSNPTKMQWIGIDAVTKNFDRKQNEIVHDTANFNSETFWYNFLQYQGGLSPMLKYIQDLQSQTGKDINLPQFQSEKTIQEKDLDILPYTLPYDLGSGIDSDGNAIDIENWSELPDSRRYQVKISVLREADSFELVSKIFYASEVNNRGIDLSYEGATTADQQVIDSYGGIHATPAALVDIHPYFTTDRSRDDGTNGISIGDSLILQFDYSVNGTMIDTDQKYSVAGNSEGIYIAFSKVAEKSNLEDGIDDESEILLEGNTGMAWKYLREVDKDMELLGKSLDYGYDFEFMRAVVTQNRVLAKSGGIPTTFDFEGFTMDASTYLSDYSNRGNYKAHQYDFRLLWGEQASYYEGQVFSDLSGLEGISTVSGLQHAYANPADYTVNIIDSRNESVINTLALSANTLAIMHSDVQAGNTIITPNKPVVKGNFNGTLYISLDPEKTGKYAIGEQVANGSWTTNPLNPLSYTDANSTQQTGFVSEETNSSFYFEDTSVDSVACKVSNIWKAGIIARPDWNSIFGFPCFEQTRQFGTKTHSYILASNWIRFESPSDYAYWVWKENIKGVLLGDKNGDAQEGLSNVRLDGLFKFNTTAGTYSWYGHYGGPYDDGIDPYRKSITAYYQPMSNQIGKGRLVYGDILGKLTEPNYSSTCINNCNSSSYVLYKLGFPTLNRADAAPHVVDWGRDTNGFYQSFIGGQIYEDTTWSNGLYYVPEKIRDYYNDGQFAINGKLGTGGKFGFPTSDPRLKNNGTILKQSFESGDGIVWDKTTGSVGIEYDSKYYCDEVNGEDSAIIAKAFFEGAWDGGRSGVKGVLVFLGIAGGGGAVIDFAFGTHGAATWVGLVYIGGILAEALLTVDIQDMIVGLENRVQYEITNSNCTARQAYLLAKYSTEFYSYIIGFRGFNKISGIVGTLSEATLVEANLNIIKNSFKAEIKSVLNLSDNATASFAKLGETNYLKYTNDLYATGRELSGQDFINIAKRAYYGAAYNEAIASTNEFKALTADNLLFQDVKHIKFMNSKGEGGHTFTDLNRMITNGAIEAQTINGQKITNLSQVQADINGVRKIWVIRGNGSIKTNHTVFPEGIADMQWRNAALDIMNQQSNATGIISGNSTFLPGIELELYIYEQNGQKYIRTIYPKFQN